MENKKAAFIGGGIIGSGLAVNALMHGWDVTVMNTRGPAVLEPGFRSIFKVFVDNGVCTREQADAWFDSIVFTTDVETAVKDAALVQESIVERVEAKRELYARIQKLRGGSVLIASSTSAIFPSALREGALYPEKVVVGHPYNPAHLLPIMEICGGENADESVIQAVKAVYKSWGKVPVICRKEVKGFVVNRINWSATEICRSQVCDGVCSYEDMDKAIMYGPGLRMAVAGQLLATSLGVDGGFRNMCAKYNLPPNPQYDILADQEGEMYAHRSGEEGQDAASAAAYRDRMIIEFLKSKKLM